MIWFTWRQFRTPAWIAGCGLVVTAVLLAITGHNLADQWTASGAGACHADCSGAFKTFADEVGSSINDSVYNAGLMVMYVVPALVGIFWGAPLISRELEVGTHRLAWNQSVTRTRWLASKLAILGTASATTAGLLSWAVTAWAYDIDYVNDNRIRPLVYGARGIVPIGYAVFAFALGVTLGMLIRRTVPAMAATLVVYVGAVVSMPQLIRAHLLPVSHATPPLDITKIDAMEIMGNGTGSPTMKVVGSDIIPDGAWVLSNNTITPTGQIFTGPPNPQFCGEDHGPRACLQWVGSLGLRQDVSYQPASHFWPLQWTETGIFVAVAVLLAGFCFLWTRRRLS
jgi:hypothetical protein